MTRSPPSPGRPRSTSTYVDSGMRARDDTGYMRRVQPEYELKLPRW
ncbi:hypothetical protein ACIQU3_25755 [Streptomyces sp. NPDC101110]